VTSRRSYALSALIAVMLVWGSTFVITKAAVRDIPPGTLAALRFLIALVVLVPFALARGGLARLPRPLPIGALVAMGVTGIALFTVGFNFGLHYGSASQGALIFALVPAAVAGAAVIALKERISRRRALGILLSVAGVGWVAVSGQQDTASPNPMLGAVCMLATVIAWAIYTAIAKRLADADQVVVLTVTTAIGALILLPFAAVELMQDPRPMPSLQAWAGTVYLGVVASAVSYLVYNLTLRHLDASLVGALTNLDPIVGIVTAVLFLGESLGGGQIAGGLIALVGMWLAS
jgi:drug/metabolite transporter (DMT)-like permease